MALFSPKILFQWLTLKQRQTTAGEDNDNKGSHRVRKVQFFFNIVQKAFDPPPLLFLHHVLNFSEGILTKVRKRLSRQLSTK